MAFPSSPTNGQQYVSSGYTYQYNATLKTWTKVAATSQTIGTARATYCLTSMVKCHGNWKMAANSSSIKKLFSISRYWSLEISKLNADLGPKNAAEALMLQTVNLAD